MLYLIIGILVIMIVLLLHGYGIMKEERDIAIMQREGYEQKYNSFRLRYNLLSMMEDKSTIIQNMAAIPQPLYIYGGGIIGEKLLHIFKEEKIGVTRVLEGSELENNPRYGKSLDTSQYVIVTPMHDYNKINELLGQYFTQEHIIGIDEIISR